MAVIAILVTLAVHSFFGYTKRAKIIKLKNDARVISDASDRYYIDHGDWPFLMIGGEPKRILDEDLIEEIKQNIVYRAESFDENKLGDDLVLYEIDTDKLIGKYINNIKSDPGCFLAVQGNPDFSIIAVNVRREISKEEGHRLPSNDEIPIYSARQLASIGVDENYPLNGKYIQMEMIDLSREGNWIPIANVDGENGVGDEYFSGTFDGNGFTIRNLKIKRNEDHQGLFKRISGKLVNISFVNVDVSGYQYIGALVGDNHGIIENCTSNGKVYGNSNIGGLVGINRSDLKSSRSECNVSGSYNIGGLVGGNQGSIENCNFIGKAIGEENGYSVGGIVGYNSNTVDNSHSSGDIFSGGSNTGGIAGTSTDTITESISNGKITGDNNNTGGIVGYNDGEIRNSNFDGNVSGDDSVGGIVGCNNNGEVEYSYLDTNGVVSGRVCVGGVVGLNTNNSVIDTCYSVGGVSGEEGKIGGLVGYNDNSKVQKCYFYWQC